MRNLQTAFVTVALMAIIVPGATVRAQVTFQQIPGLAFFDDQGYLNGISWVDIDNDNDLDVCVSGQGGVFPNFTNASAIFINNGNETFTNTGLLNSVQKNPFRHGWADYNNDGFPDLYIAATWNNNGINELWTNNNGASFSSNTGSGATPNTAQPYEGTVSWVDYNNDGWADLFLPRWNDLKNKLYKNNGNGSFSDITNSGLTNDLAWTSGGFWGDYDNDRDADLFVVNYQIGASTPGNNDLFRNNGDGTFTKINTAGDIVTIKQNGRSANWVDADNNGFLDVFVCNQFGQDLLHLNNGNGTFNTVPIGSTNHTSWSSNWGDYDNDGDEDLITIGFWGTDSRFWQNDGFGNLSDITAAHPNIFPTGTSGSNSNAIIWADYNNDGWLDLHLAQPDVLTDHFYENEKTGCRSWLEIDCEGMATNRAAIGVTLRAKTIRNGQGWWQMRYISAQTAATGTNPMRQHFGLDGAVKVDSLIVQWPSGATCVFTDVAVNQIIHIKEDCSLESAVPPVPLPGETQYISVCLPENQVTLTAPSPAGGVWSASCGNCVDQSGVFSSGILPADTYTVVYRQGNNICNSSSDTFIITLNNAPVLQVSADISVYVGQQVTLHAEGAPQLNWTPAGSLSCSNCSDPVFTADSTTLFYVSASSSAGCAATDSVLVTVKENPEFDIPNAFTPNGDGKNDRFKPAYTGEIFTRYQLKVFNRWGEKVYETLVPGQGWDGTFNSMVQPSDVYAYIFEYELIDGKKDIVNGSVSLLR